MQKETLDKVTKFWKFLYDMHLYEKKGEGFFKAFIITFSWVGGVHLKSLPNEITTPLATSFFLFSIAIIMEYTVRFVTTKEIAKKILPLFILGISFWVSLVAFGELTNHPFSVAVDTLYKGLIVPQFIIWFDVIIHVMIEKPGGKNKLIETTLKDMEVYS